MYSRRICEKCKLTVFAESEEKLVSKVKKYRCQCGANTEERKDEWMGRRILSSKKNVRWESDDLESSS